MQTPNNENEKQSSQPAHNRAQGIIAVRGKAIGYVATTLFDEDVQIQTERLNTALNGDTVEIAILPQAPNERVQGEVVRVMDRAKTKFVGTIEVRDGTTYLKPDDRRMYTDLRISNPTEEAVPGVKVLVRLTAWEHASKTPEGEVLQVIGKKGDHETEMRAIVLSGGFELDFPEDVEREARDLDTRKVELMEEAAEHPARRDMRGITTFTIDPVDAKDFDDALSLKIFEDGTYEVGVHIADVSHFVRPGTPIDKEAVERGTSIYLVDRTIPMLPEVLSNDLCSLRPDVDRLAFSAVFTMTPRGEILTRWFGETTIHSNKRFSYEEAQGILDAGAGEFHNELRILDDLSRILRKERYEEGSIAFDTDEVRFVLDEDGVPVKVYKKIRLDTMLMIEDWMLLANKEVTEEVHRIAKRAGSEPAFVYRIHDVPNPEKIEELDIFLRAIGYDLKAQKGIVTARNINVLLKQVEGKPEESLVKTATIRSMAKAIYSTKNIGHFGLAFRFYTHFTSPIRRYPDLMVHRILKRYLSGGAISKQELMRYERLSVQSSQCEVAAVEAERDSIKYKQVEYMKTNVGQTFDGVISGVSEWGIFVEEVNTKAEGLVKVRSMSDDFYVLDRKKYALVGSRTNKKYTLGDKVKVKLVGADLEQKTLDWELVRDAK